MKTAEEIAIEIHRSGQLFERNGGSDTIALKKATGIIKEYARQKCKEQREICAEYAWRKWNPETERFIEDSVRKSPEPKFD